MQTEGEGSVALGRLLEFLTENRAMHICVQDVSGIGGIPALRVRPADSIHSIRFCSAAKSTRAGYRLCIRCKLRAGQKAASGKTAFCGCCPYGLFEVVEPVTVGKKVLCILYLGNFIFSREETERRLRRACRVTGVPPERMQTLLAEAEPISTPGPALRLADFLCGFIRMLYGSGRPKGGDPKPCHWAVEAVRNYVDLNYMRNFSLRGVSRMLFINEKYIGRLFKKQVGRTFHAYLNEVRLQKAAERLRGGRDEVISVALSCGFQNVTYFNRVFRKEFGTTPTLYRAQAGDGGAARTETDAGRRQPE